MRHGISILGLILISGIAALSGCKPDATPRAKQGEEWVNKFYTRYSIRGAWGYFGAEAKNNDVVIEINVPEQQANELMAMEISERNAFIARNSCPPRDEKIWNILGSNGDVIVHTRRSGNAFATVSCRRDNIKG